MIANLEYQLLIECVEWIDVPGSWKFECII